MKQLLQFEIRKLFRAKVLYLCAGIMVLIIIIFAGLDKVTELALQEMSGYSPADEAIIEDFYSSGDDISDSMVNSMGITIGGRSGRSRMLGAVSNVYVVMILGVFASVFICGDFGNAVVKNIITKGYTRTQIYFAKYIVTMVVLLVLAVIAMVTGLLGGTFMWSIGKNWSAEVFLRIFLQLICIAAYSTMFAFFAAWLKRVGTALAFSMAVPIVLSMMFSIIDLLLYESNIGVEDYWLSGILATFTDLSAEPRKLVIAFMCSATYLVGFTLLGWLAARRREV